MKNTTGIEKHKGIVSTFRAGYGFIDETDTGKTYFVHQSEIVMEGFRKLKRGQNVLFEVGEDPQGRPCAKQVVVI